MKICKHRFIFTFFVHFRKFSSRRMAFCSSGLHTRRHIGVEGAEGKRNDVIFCSSKDHAPITQHVIFFGGDVQNYPEEMTREDLKQYSQWNLEATAEILARRFPNSAVMVVKPAVMFLKMFSIFSNFLPFSDDGIPKIGGESGSMNHLVHLYRNSLKTDQAFISACSEQGENVCTNSEDIHSKPVILAGFSKGCVVLNQLMFDLDPNSQDEDQKNFIKNLKAVYWLDSGHVGNKNAWITDDEVLKKMTDFKLSLYAHVTPYQIRDSIRKWIGEEEEIFVQKLKDLGADITEARHFFREKGSIENHFKLLKEF